MGEEVSIAALPVEARPVGAVDTRAGTGGSVDGPNG
jgi:hypothetical protein